MLERAHWFSRLLLVATLLVVPLTQASSGSPARDDAEPETESAAVSDLEAEYDFDPADEFAIAKGAEKPDPWEGFNRAIFRFNEGADRWVLKPVAISYRQIVPKFAQSGVSNFFSNLGEITNAANDLLQWKWRKAGNDSGRFIVNTTLGVAGLFDVARHMGLGSNDREDFGQTLAVWGVSSGPYLMLPLLGPSTLRDAPARFVDRYAYPLTYVDSQGVRWGLRTISVAHTRARFLEQEAVLRGDRYLLIRDAYLQRREYLVNDGELEDDFGGYLEEGAF